MEYRRLTAFVKVAQGLNTTDAAANLHISQSALSRRITELEEELSVKLFERTTVGMSLTAAGSAFLPLVENIVKCCQDASAKMGQFRMSEAGPLSIGYMALTMKTVLLSLLREFARFSPEVKISLTELSAGEQITALRAKTIEIAFLGTPVGLHSEFHVWPVFTSPMCVVLPENHRYATAKTIDLNLLKTENFIGLSPANFPGRNEMIREICSKVHFRPELSTHADSIASQFGLITVGQGIALLPGEKDAVPHEGLAFVPLSCPVVKVQSAAVWRKESASPSLTSFTAFLQKKYPEKAKPVTQSLPLLSETGGAPSWLRLG